MNRHACFIAVAICVLGYVSGSISPENAVSEVTLIEEVPPSIMLTQGDNGGASAKDTIAAIVDLKAYVNVLKSKSSFYNNFSDKKKNALFALVEAFSVPAKDDDIVIQYGKMMGSLLDGKMGIFKYILENVNSRVLQGQTVIRAAPEDDDDDTNTPKMCYDWTNLGLMGKPEYIVKLAIATNLFADAKGKLHAGDGGKAIANWIKSGTATLFDKCVKHSMAKYVMMAKNKYTVCAAACQRVINADYLAEDAKKGSKKAAPDAAPAVQKSILVQKFNQPRDAQYIDSHNQDVLAPLPTSCTDGTWTDAPAECDWKAPGGKEIAASCTASADASMKTRAKEVTLARIEKELEQKEQRRKDDIAKAAAKVEADAAAKKEAVADDTKCTMVKTAVGAPGGGSGCNDDGVNGCLYDSTRCTNKYDGQCGILESQVQTVCGNWDKCDGVVCRADYGGYCLARGKISDRVKTTMWAYKKSCKPTAEAAEAAQDILEGMIEKETTN